MSHASMTDEARRDYATWLVQQKKSHERPAKEISEMEAEVLETLARADGSIEIRISVSHRIRND